MFILVSSRFRVDVVPSNQSSMTEAKGSTEYGDQSGITSKSTPLDENLRWSKLYTPDSVVSGGSFALKGVEGAFVDTEKEIQRQNSRVQRAEYRELEKKKKRPDTAADGSASSPSGSPSAKTAKRRRTGTPIFGACDWHNDPDCAEDICLSEYFETYSHLDEVDVVQHEPNRLEMGHRQLPVGRTNLAAELTLSKSAQKELFEHRYNIAINARDASIVKRPFLRKKTRLLVRSSGDNPIFKPYGNNHEYFAFRNMN